MPNPTPKHPPVKLTKGYIDKVRPGAADEFHWCIEPKRFGLRVNPSGKLSFIVQGRLAPRKPPARITIGPYGVFRGTASDKRTTAQRFTTGFIEPVPWEWDGGKRREPVLDLDRNPPLPIRHVGWRCCMRCAKPFWSEDTMRLRMCDRCKGLTCEKPLGA